MVATGATHNSVINSLKGLENPVGFWDFRLLVQNLATIPTKNVLTIGLLGLTP